jgi:hypothetical protein
VVEALESWASREAAAIMVGLFIVAAIVTVAATPAALALGGPRSARAEAPAEVDARMLAADGSPEPDLIL